MAEKEANNLHNAMISAIMSPLFSVVIRLLVFLRCYQSSPSAVIISTLVAIFRVGAFAQTDSENYQIARSVLFEIVINCTSNK